MRAIEFATLYAAAWHRTYNGGWLFVPDAKGSCVYWFNATHYTPTTVMLHPLTKGKSGELVCDDRYLTPLNCQYRRQPDGHMMLCDANGKRSIFDDVDE